MSGLIWKDFLVMRKTLRLYMLFFAGYFLLAILGIFDLSFVTSFSTVITLILPVSIFSYDEINHWERFARALPIGARGLVGARYCFVLLLLGAVSLLSLIAGIVLSLAGSGSLPEGVATLLVSMGIGLLVVDIMLPLNYKMGPERARPYLFAILFLPFIALFLLEKAGAFQGLDLSFLDRIPPMAAAGCFALFPLAALIGLVLSFLVSCRIVENKEV